MKNIHAPWTFVLAYLAEDGRQMIERRRYHLIQSLMSSASINATDGTLLSVPKPAATTSYEARHSFGRWALDRFTYCTAMTHSGMTHTPMRGGRTAIDCIREESQYISKNASLSTMIGKQLFNSVYAFDLFLFIGVDDGRRHQTPIWLIESIEVELNACSLSSSMHLASGSETFEHFIHSMCGFISIHGTSVLHELGHFLKLASLLSAIKGITGQSHRYVGDLVWICQAVGSLAILFQ